MINNLENQAPADTFKSLLQTGNNAGVQGTITTIQDGAGVDTALAISNNAARVNGAFAVTGNLDVAGDFTVNGTTTTINTETLNIEDETLVIASNVDHTELVQPSGILWGMNANPPQLTYQEGIGFNFSGGDLLKDGNLYGISQLAVTAAGGAFSIDGESRKNLNLQRGLTYRFDQSNATNANHPLKFSTVSDGIHTTPGSEYTVGVVTVGTPGETGAYTQITLTPSTPNLYYYCGNHSGMGGDALGSLTLESAGYVGIGTTSPNNLLHVKRETTDNTYAIIENTTVGNAGINLKNASGDWNIVANADLRFIDNANGAGDRMRIDSDGRVGIGTTSPSAKLEVLESFQDYDPTTIPNRSVAILSGSPQNSYSSIGLESRSPDNTDASISTITCVPVGNGSSALAFGTRHQYSFRERMRIDSDGNVGIGTEGASTKLEVKQGTAVNTLTEALRIIGGNYSIDNNAESFKFFHQTTNTNTNRGIAFKSIDGSLQIQTIVTSSDLAQANNICIQPEGGNVGIGTDDPTAPLEVSSTTGGVILPRLTDTEMNAVSNPTNGEIIYNTTRNQFWGYANGIWQNL